MAHHDDLYTQTLRDLRGEMHARFTWLAGGFAAFSAYLLLFEMPFRADLAAILLTVAGAAALARRARQTRPNLARYGFVAAAHLALLTAMWIEPNPWLPFISLPLTLLSALLVSHSSALVAPLAPAFAVALTLGGWAQYPLPPLLMLAAFNLAVVRTALATFYTALWWYRATQQRADALLEEARARRAELAVALKSLEASYQTQARMQGQLAYAQRQAQEARRMKERFAANISHELRTPLNLILGFSEMIYLRPEVYGDSVALPPKLYRDIDQIHRSSKHLLALIDDVLDLSHIELSGFAMNFAPTDLNAFLAETVGIVGNLFQAGEDSGGARFQAEIAPNLPTLDLDATRVRQVLLNLLNNAQRFTPRGVVTLRVGLDTAGEAVEFCVIDTGIGIAADKLAHVFDEFYQVDFSLSRSHGGAGLGLAITRRFVEAHGGQITVESVEGRGSTFRFSLPLPRRAPDSPARSLRPTTRAAREPERTILVIDPDPAVATMIQRHLGGAQVVALATEDGLEAAVTAHRPRAVVRNALPGSPSLPAELPVPVIECALPSTGWMIAQLGVAACLSKPITRAQIAEQLARLPPMAEHSRSHSRGHPRSRPRRVLVVDDDLGFVQLVQRTIESLHDAGEYAVLRAYDGAQALAVARQNSPDLILLDLAMPELDGFAVIEALRADAATADIPIVLLTATRYVQDALEHNGALIVRQAGGLYPAEVLRCLRALIDQLEPRYEQWLEAAHGI